MKNLHSIRTRLLGMMMLLTLFFSFYLLRDVATNFSAMQEGSRISAVSEVSVASSTLNHELQKERGLSSGFLASKGEKFRDEMMVQRKVTDEHAKVLSEAIKQQDSDLPATVKKAWPKPLPLWLKSMPAAAALATKCSLQQIRLHGLPVLSSLTLLLLPKLPPPLAKPT